MHPGEIAIIVMAGGYSRRFGPDDKLLADLGGQALGLHAARRLGGMGWGARIAVARPPLAAGLERLGYRVLEPPPKNGLPENGLPENGLGDNLALAANALDGVRAALIVLADMPFVTVEHVRAMTQAARLPSSIVCTATEGHRSPPVLIGSDHFAALRTLSGDEGARRLFARAGTDLIEIAGDAHVSADIDTPEALRNAQTGPN